MLNNIELNFIAELNKEYLKNNKFSFMNILFCSEPDKQINLMENALNGVYNKKHRKIIQQSDIIFRTQDSFYLGKIDEHFWLYSNEGELWGAGKEIQNTCNLIRDVFYFPLDDKSVIDDMFERNGFGNYDAVSSDYSQFCRSLGFTFNDNEAHWDAQAEDFYKNFKV